jgi:hypothetical protein
MTQSPDNLPYWRKPVVRVDQVVDPLEASVTDGPPIDDADPLADLPPETVVMAGDEAAPADDEPARGNMSSPQAHASSLSVMDAQSALADSHLRMRQANAARQIARGKVAQALERFQRVTGQRQTQADLIRQHLASEHQFRADRAAGKIAPRPQPRLGSAVDAYSFYTRNSGRGAGGGRAFGRGAFPKSMRGRVIPK